MKASDDSNHFLSTERLLKDQLQQLTTENEILKNIIALIPGNVFWKDKKGRFLGCNNNVARLLGLESPVEIVGKTNSELLGGNVAELIDQNDTIVNSAGKESYFEEIGWDMYQNPATYLTKKLPLYDDQSNYVGILGVSFDITERKKMEEDLKIAKEKAEASNRAKSQFLAVVNHELRTPLASIVGLVDFLKQVDLPAREEQNIIEAIENCTRHLLGLVNDVLDVSKLEAGKYNVRHNVVNVSSLIQEVQGIVNSLAVNKGLELRVNIMPNTPESVLTDVRIVRQILINLLGNAIKFTDSGHITIQVKPVSTMVDQRVRLEFSVIDTGTGIPEDKLNVIFEPFQQLEGPYTRQSSRSGTGLGLTIVEKLTALVNGKINVTSEPGIGSTFSITCDFEVRDHSIPNATDTQVHIARPVNRLTPFKVKAKAKLRRSPRVLLIEDDPIVQYVHTKMLIDMGCDVDAVSNGHDALQKLDDHHLIFADISLPDINGFEVIKQIRELTAAQNHIPIIALTVYTGKEERAACLDAGADEFASKPITAQQLEKMIYQQLERFQPQLFEEEK